MSVEAGRVPEQQEEFALLQSCFVEGSAEQRKREKRIRRRALIISIAAQSAILTLIVLIPLFGKPEVMVHAFVPIPPYYHSNTPDRPTTNTTEIPRRDRNLCATCYSPNFPAHPATTSTSTDNNSQAGIDIGEGANTPQPAWGLLGSDTRPQPPAPEVKPQTPRRIFQGHVEPAMLIHRVEPTYPPLARQAHVEGRVELHAIIATDGTMQSLQIISGHPLLLQSAKEAVLQWRYKPTILNGQAVEVDTYITVIYTFQH